MKINFSSNAIEISRTFAKKASHFGSIEYQQLRAATLELPNFKVVVKAAPKSFRTYTKGLTYEFMEAYISKNDEDNTLMNNFQCMRHGCSYGEIKRWFLMKFPEIYNFAA